MDAEIINFIAKYIWLPLIGFIGWLWKDQGATIKDMKAEIAEIQREYVSRAEFQRGIDSLEKKIDKQDIKLDKHDTKLDRILERLSDKRQ